MLSIFKIENNLPSFTFFVINFLILLVNFASHDFMPEKLPHSKSFYIILCFAVMKGLYLKCQFLIQKVLAVF